MLELSDDQLLKNIQRIQNESNIKQSASLVKDLGRCSLDIEMETGCKRQEKSRPVLEKNQTTCA